MRHERHGLLVGLASARAAGAPCGTAAAVRPGSDKPAIRLGLPAFPNGDLVVKHNRWLEEALPDYKIKWTKFDSGGDMNTAFVAGSSTSARSAPARWRGVCRRR